ncbi:50S ribosomal protein L10 [Candidatus Dependentiae bacterium]|nr:50S ribosomal protein L10 [Candidatus Dependentiae bacterium]
MNRQQKEAVVSDLKEMFSNSKAAFLVGYKGLDVASIQSLRGELREVGAHFKVTKARLMKIASQDIDIEGGLQDVLKDQVGLVFVKEEVPGVAKVLSDFSKKNEALQIISGLFESKVLSSKQVEFIASIPSKDVLVAQLLATIQAPVSQFVRLLNTMNVRLLYVLKQISEKKTS